MNSVVRKLAAVLPCRRGLSRLRTVWGYFSAPLRQAALWLGTSNECTNFTYDLTEANVRHLAALLALVTRAPADAVEGYLREIEGDAELRAHVLGRTAAGDASGEADRAVRYGRRIGWYALVRILKPRIVVETGVDKGLGACVLTAALRRNAAEGAPGRYWGTDINPKAGYLLAGEYARYGEILYGDSVASLRGLAGPIDLFVNDSDHSAAYEQLEYETIREKLSPQAFVLGDNAHVTDALWAFSRDAGRHFVFFREVPKAHWYPGGGIGISFPVTGEA